MNIFTIIFLIKFLAKYSPKRTILKNFLGGSMPPNPPNKTRGFATRCMALRAMQIPPLLQKYFEPPPPK